MDKKIFRSFSLRHLESDRKKGVCPVLFMYSSVEGEYGPISLTIAAELEIDSPMFVCNFKETSGASLDEQHAFRSNEIFYFVHSILPLFNPLTIFHDEVPFPSSQDS